MEPASPLLPWEVIERVIGHSEHRLLFNFSLTCRDLRPRALCLLVADVFFWDDGRVKLFTFRDLLKVNPQLKPFVRSVDVQLHDFAPFPLLSIAPNLSELRFYGFFTKPVQMSLNQSTLTACRHLGTRIRTLHLSTLVFATYPDFVRLLLAFTNLRDIICENITFRMEGPRALIDGLRRNPQRLPCLRTVDIHMGGDSHNAPSIAALLLDSGLVQSTVEILSVSTTDSSFRLSNIFTWPQLQSLVLHLSLTDKFTQDLPATTLLLKCFPPSTLKDVTLYLNISIADMFRDDAFFGEVTSGLCKELEQTLLRFSQPRLTMWLDHGYTEPGMFDGAISFWIHEIGKRFPVLLQRGAFTLTPAFPREGEGHIGKEPRMCIATSPDGKWVATGARDFTIILWSTTTGAIARQWIAHDYQFINSLAFSPDSRYLVSGGGGPNVKVWDVAEGSCAVTATLKGSSQVICCAWSPRGDIIASQHYDSTLRLWDASAFQELHVLDQDQDRDQEDQDTVPFHSKETRGLGPVKLLHFEDPELGRWFIAFSRDGRWLVSGSKNSYRVWNVASGTLHKSFHPYNICRLSAAFDPGSTRLLFAEYFEAKLVDVETGKELAVLRLRVGRRLDGTENVAFSPDGTLVVTGSSNGMVKLWDGYAGAVLFTLEGHEKTIAQVCFSLCGKYVASASRDGTVRLWRSRDGSCVATFSEHQTSVRHVAFCPDGETLWSGDSRGRVIMRWMRDILPTDEQDI